MENNITMKTVALAKRVFETSVSNVMAHTIRGIETALSNEYEVRVSIVIIPEERLASRNSDFCLLFPQWVNWREEDLGETKLIANILIHPHATRCAARFAISHELFHILDELEYFKENGHPHDTGSYSEKRNKYKEYFDSYENGTNDDLKQRREALENYASQFAGELCRHHYKLINNESIRKRFHSLPDTFGLPCAFADIRTWLDNIRGVAVDEENPFYKKHSYESIFH